MFIRLDPAIRTANDAGKVPSIEIHVVNSASQINKRLISKLQSSITSDRFYFIVQRMYHMKCNDEIFHCTNFQDD